MLAIGRQPDAGDKAHGSLTTLNAVIPGWSEGPDPESRDSGFVASRHPGMTLWEADFSSSIRFRQTEHLLGNETENKLRADRRDARDQRLPQIALDVIFFGVPKSAMRHDRLLAGVEAGFGGEIFCGIGRRAALHALVVLPACAEHHHPRGFQLHPVLR